MSRQRRDIGDIDIFRRQLHIDFTVEIGRAGGGEHARTDRHMQFANGRHAIGVIRLDFRRAERFAVNAAVFQFAVDAQTRVGGRAVEFDMPRHLTGQVLVGDIRQTQKTRNIRSLHVAGPAEHTAVQAIRSVQTIDAVALRQRRIGQSRYAFGVS